MNEIAWFVIVVAVVITLCPHCGRDIRNVYDEVTVSAPISGKLDITCYSCGGVIYENKVEAEDYRFPDSGGVRFLDKQTGSWVNLSADCVVKVEK